MKFNTNEENPYEVFKHCPDPKVLQRFVSKIAIRDNPGCWTWIASIYGKVYGGFKFEKRTWLVHRLAWLWAGLELPEGRLVVLDHVCRNTLCCRPGHLRVVTQQFNSHVGVGPTAINHAKEFCIRGHSLSGPNLLKAPAKKGYRGCKICKRIGEASCKLRRKSKESECVSTSS